MSVVSSTAGISRKFPASWPFANSSSTWPRRSVSPPHATREMPDALLAHAPEPHEKAPLLSANVPGPWQFPSPPSHKVTGLLANVGAADFSVRRPVFSKFYRPRIQTVEFWRNCPCPLLLWLTKDAAQFCFWRMILFLSFSTSPPGRRRSFSARQDSFYYAAAASRDSVAR